MAFNAILVYRLDLIFFFLVSLLLMGAAHWIRIRRGSRQGMPFWVWSIWALFMAASLFLAEKSGIDEEKQILGMIEGMAPTYAEEMKRLGHEKISVDTPADDPTYLSLIAAEKSWLKSNQMVSDIYTFGKDKDGRVVLLVDSETDYNRNGKYDEDREGRTEIGELFPQQDAVVLKALNGEKSLDLTPYSDRWGTWVSVYYPMTDSQGRPHGALGVDYAAEEWISAVLMNRITVLAFAFMGVLILIGYGLADSIFRSKDIYFKALIENALDVVTVLDTRGRVMFESPSIHTVLGYLPSEMVGKIAFDFIHPDDLPDVIEVFGKVVKSAGETHRVKFRFRHQDGSWRFMESVATNLSHNPNVKGVIVNSRDITESKRAQEELEASRVISIQQSKMASLGEMASGIAHEINTPLGVITGRAEQMKKILSEMKADASLTQCAEVIRDMSMRIAKIVRSLRSFSRDASKDPFVRTPLQTVIDDAVSISMEKFKNHGIELNIEKIPDTAFDCRAAEISQVLINLLSNAFDAVESAPKEKKVLIAASADTDFITIRISDTGPGVEAELKEKIFDPFFTTKQIGKGTGLGLSICRSIVEAHGGEIFYTSSGSGACFTLRLPKCHERQERAA